MELMELLMNKTKKAIVSSSSFETQNRVVGSGWAFFIFRERRCVLSRFPVIRTVDSRRSMKKSCSRRRGLRVDTDLVEFRQLQEVGIFSYLC